jgi:hypothetical protein
MSLKAILQPKHNPLIKKKKTINHINSPSSELVATAMLTMAATAA